MVSCEWSVVNSKFPLSRFTTHEINYSQLTTDNSRLNHQNQLICIFNASLKHVDIIKGFISGLLLSLFVLGITPKQVLHDLLTHHNHVDVKDKTADWIGKDRFNCDDENFVAESPFVHDDNSVIINTPCVFKVNTDFNFLSYFFLHQHFLELRGPPIQS